MKDNPLHGDAVVIYSGGLDSTTLLYDYWQSVALAVTFDYGSNHAEREIACARWHCSRLGVEHLVVPLGFMKDTFRSSLLMGAGAVPEGDYNAENMASTVVPFRNGIMLAVAAGLAESRGLRRVLMANHSGDHFVYPDCRPGFVEAMGGAIAAGTTNGVVLEAPYTLWSKADIVRRGSELGVDFAHTYSCYRGGEWHCGRCGTCRERQEAFREAGVADPTRYE